MTAKVITVFNQKGGVGKTTVTMQVAGALSLRGAKVRVLDMDRQQTATSWAAVGAEQGRDFPAQVSNFSAFGGAIAREIMRVAEEVDYVLIDCPPAIDSPIPAAALSMSDLGLIPIPPRPADFNSSAAAKALAKQIQSTNRDLRLLAVGTMVDTSSKTTKEILAALAEDNEVPLAKVTLGRRVAFSDAPGFGAMVHDLEGAKKSASEVDRLTDEILTLLGG